MVKFAWQNTGNLLITTGYIYQSILSISIMVVSRTSRRSYDFQVPVKQSWSIWTTELSESVRIDAIIATKQNKKRIWWDKMYKHAYLNICIKIYPTIYAVYPLRDIDGFVGLWFVVISLAIISSHGDHIMYLSIYLRLSLWTGAILWLPPVTIQGLSHYDLWRHNLKIS